MNGTQVDSEQCEAPNCTNLALARVPSLIKDLKQLNPEDKEIEGFVCQSCINGHNSAVTWTNRVQANSQGVSINGP